jgi:hypothetical protein
MFKNILHPKQHSKAVDQKAPTTTTFKLQVQTGQDTQVLDQNMAAGSVEDCCWPPAGTHLGHLPSHLVSDGRCHYYIAASAAATTAPSFVLFVSRIVVVALCRVVVICRCIPAHPYKLIASIVFLISMLTLSCPLLLLQMVYIAELAQPVCWQTLQAQPKGRPDIQPTLMVSCCCCCGSLVAMLECCRYAGSCFVNSTIHSYSRVYPYAPVLAWQTSTWSYLVGYVAAAGLLTQYPGRAAAGAAGG